MSARIPQSTLDAAAVNRGDDEHHEAEEDHRRREHDDNTAVHLAHAADFPVATMTRTGACLSTKSTVSLKTPRVPAPRGAPITMISLCRRVASSTIALPALRARTIRSVTSTP